MFSFCGCGFVSLRKQTKFITQMLMVPNETNIYHYLKKDSKYVKKKVLAYLHGCKLIHSKIKDKH